ncbi:hypothetical protein [Phnomibacter ginsenosidimutans]|uniref:Uncharacterized protein n=1 Tax=Phnomibacter ginsenosidimutans TaxID=2676868 RepID=A0A6I6GJG2_9BACT|nr:hypothetical protein [Phnomibacter ginsenosidimutans]QGW27798.1 hypothetical protein GLV81_06540 [Phnomibacter ginsenosidimutans]
MKKHLIAATVSSIALVLFAYLCLIIMPNLPESIVEDYFSPSFVNDESRNLLYFVQPIVLSFALSWFWTRFKDSFAGNWMLKGLELGLVYALIASLPAMILLYSAIDVTAMTVGTWLLYSFAQATIAGEISARIDP